MKDSRLKYVEILDAFNCRATEVDLFCKQSQRICEKLAKKLAADKPKTAHEFEKSEYLKEFVVKVSKNNERTIELLMYIKGFLQDILDDSAVLIEGAVLREKLKDQSTTIEILMQTQTNLVNDLRRGIKANFKPTA